MQPALLRSRRRGLVSEPDQERDEEPVSRIDVDVECRCQLADRYPCGVVAGKRGGLAGERREVPARGAIYVRGATSCFDEQGHRRGRGTDRQLDRAAKPVAVREEEDVVYERFGGLD